MGSTRLRPSKRREEAAFRQVHRCVGWRRLRTEQRASAARRSVRWDRTQAAAAADGPRAQPRPRIPPMEWIRIAPAHALPARRRVPIVQLLPLFSDSLPVGATLSGVSSLLLKLRNYAGLHARRGGAASPIPNVNACIARVASAHSLKPSQSGLSQKHPTPPSVGLVRYRAPGSGRSSNLHCCRA